MKKIISLLSFGRKIDSVHDLDDWKSTLPLKYVKFSLPEGVAIPKTVLTKLFLSKDRRFLSDIRMYNDGSDLFVPLEVIRERLQRLQKAEARSTDNDEFDAFQGLDIIIIF